MIELAPAALVAIVTALLAGCETVEPQPYRPERAIVASIPREAALKAVRELLGVAHPYSTSWKEAANGLTAVQVTDRGFSAACPYGPGTETKEYVFAQLDPKAYRDPQTGGFMVALLGGDGTFYGTNLVQGDILWFDRREDLETFMEALASLR
jgi:hypothetical protein